jgi:hypothetical protein
MVTPTSFTSVRLKEKESVFEIQQCTLCVCVVAAGSRMSIMDVCSQHTNRSAMQLMRDLALSCHQVDPICEIIFFIGPWWCAHQIQTQNVWALSPENERRCAFKQRPPEPIEYGCRVQWISKNEEKGSSIMCSKESGDGASREKEREREDHAINSTVCAGCVCKRVGSLP